MSTTKHTPSTAPKIDERLVDNVVIPKTMQDIPVIGQYLHSLAQRFVKVSDEEMLLLSNAFEQTESGKLKLKLHNPFVETAIFNVISNELTKLVTAAAEARKLRDKEEAEADKN